jgi:hypothetical protein
MPSNDFEQTDSSHGGLRRQAAAGRYGSGQVKQRSLTTGPVPRTKSAMRATSTPLIAIGSGAVLLGGCAFTGGVPDRLEDKIQGYYAEHAVEEGGQCATPEMASMTRRKVVGSSAARTVLRVRYSYFDSSEGAVPAWPLVLDQDRACTGSAERDFTLERGRLGYAVVGMSGPARDE